MEHQTIKKHHFWRHLYLTWPTYSKAYKDVIHDASYTITNQLQNNNWRHPGIIYIHHNKLNI